MPEEYSPLKFPEPAMRSRASLPPRAPRFASVLSSQHSKANFVRTKVRPIATAFSQLGRAQQKAIFFKIKHDGMPIDLTGTDLKVFAQGESETLAIPKADNLQRLLDKIDAFAVDVPSSGHLRNEYLVFPISDFCFGDAKDRLSEQLAIDYENLVSLPLLIYEIELFAAVDRNKREYLEQLLQEVSAALGSAGTIFEHEVNGDFLRVVVRSSGHVFQQLVEGAEWQTKIVRFEQRPEFETFTTTLSNFSFPALNVAPPEPDDAIICIVDSGVTSGNPFLESVVLDEYTKSFLADDDSAFDEYNHGSGVASLAAYQDLNISAGAYNKAKAWIANARILDSQNSIPTRLLSKVLTEVVKKYAPMGVQIFNLSVCVSNKNWNERARRASKRSSWIARKIDQLCKKYDVVFVISTGNLTNQDVNFFLQDGGDYPSYFLSDDTNILDPSQAALAITVGSIVPGATVQFGNNTAVAAQFCPSPFTRIGPGILGEIKPEVVDFGGNLVQNIGLSRVRQNNATDVLMASNKVSPALHHDVGTSYAAPRVSHKLARILKDLSGCIEERVSASLLRAFLINSASVRETPEVNSFMANFSSIASTARLFGYGRPEVSIATFGNSHAVTCFYQGEMDVDQVAFFRIPIPAEIRNASGKKRIFVTVAFAPEVQSSGLKNYLGSRLQWRIFRGDASENDIVSAMAQSDEEDSEEEFDWLADEESLQSDDSSTAQTKELKCHKYGLRLRSKGTAQHDVFEWTNHRAEFSDNDYLLAVSTYFRWSRKAVPFAVVVRIEETTGTIPIYNQVKARIEVLTVQARARARV